MIADLYTVDLSPFEVRFARGVGLARVRANVDVPDPFQGESDRDYQHVKGALGEFAFCKFANIWPPIEAVEAGVRPAHDCVLGSDRIDVKTLGPQVRSFKVTASKRGKAIDLFVGMEMLSEASFRVLGWISAEAVFAREPVFVSPADRQPRYVVGRSDLQPFVIEG